MTERQLQLTPADIERRIKFVALGPEDVARIHAIRSVIEPQAEELAATFFNYLAGFEEAKPLFTSKRTIEEARRLKREHIGAMVRGEYDRAYVDERIRLATLYSTVGLELRLVLGAFHQLMRAMGERIMIHAHNAQEVAFQNFMALKKVAFFDMGIMVDVLVYERERIIRKQQDAIRELSTPVLQVRDRLLILPIIGLLDSVRARQLTENLLQNIRSNRARMVVIDVTGVAAIDSKVANHLVQTCAASKLMGASVVITGLSAEIAQTLVTLGVDLSGLTTLGDLQGGIEEAERRLGYRVVRDGDGERSAAEI